MTILAANAFGGLWDFDVETDSDSGLFAWVSISALSFGATLFGLSGLITTWVDLSALAGVAIALLVAALGVAFHNSLFGWLRRTEASSEVRKRDLEGATGLVVLGMPAGRRGQIVVEAAGKRMRMSAMPATRADRLRKGDRVVIRKVDGGVALVARHEEEKVESG